MSIRSTMNKRLTSYYESQKIFNAVTKELSIAKDPVLSHIPAGFSFDTAAIQFDRPTPTTITFKETPSSFISTAPSYLKRVKQMLEVATSNLPNLNWVSEASNLDVYGHSPYISVSRNYIKKIHNTQTCDDHLRSDIIGDMHKLIARLIPQESRTTTADNTHLVDDIMISPIYKSLSLDALNKPVRILPETIRYRNGPHIAYNSTYIGLPIGTTFTVRDRNQKKNYITYEIVGKLINFEDTPQHPSSTMIPALTSTDASKYIDKSSFDRKLTNHLIVKPIDANAVDERELSPHGILFSALMKIQASGFTSSEALPIWSADGHLSMNRQHISGWLTTTYANEEADIDTNDVVVFNGSVTSKMDLKSAKTIRAIMEDQNEYLTHTIIPDTLDLFIEGDPSSTEQTIYSVDRTTICMPPVDFTETNSYKKLVALSEHIPDYVCQLIYDAPFKNNIDDDVYNFFY